MGTAVAIVNVKGGVAKTSTTINLGAALVELGYGVTLLDLDPTRALTVTLGERDDPLRVRAVTPRTLADHVRPDGWTLIDCPPALPDENKRALAVADAYLVPVAPSLHSMLLVRETLAQARAIHPDAGLVGILFTMVDRYGVTDAIRAELRRVFGSALLKSEIPRRLAVERAHAAGVPVLEFEPRNAASEAYRAAAREIVKRGKKKA